MQLARRLHLLPNGELLNQDRAEAERQRDEAREERQKKLAEGAALAERVRKGEEGAPLTSDAFMRSMGFPPQDEEEQERKHG